MTGLPAGATYAFGVTAGTDPLSAVSVFRSTVVRDGGEVVINWTLGAKLTLFAAVRR